MGFPWTAPDGEKFPCERWDAAGTPRGVLVCVHGMGGAAEEFAPVAHVAAGAGFACYGLNLRGQGHDAHTGRRGHYLDVPALCDEIGAFTREMAGRHAGLPVFLCGESMGALLACRAVASRHVAVDGVILSAPVVELRRPTPWLERGALRLAAAVAPRVRFNHAWLVAGKKEKLAVTRDEGHLKRLRSSPHSIRAFSFHFLNALGELISSSPTMAREMAAPCLVLAAGRDAYLSAAQMAGWFDRLGSADKTLRIYPEAYHCLWNDWEREAVLRDIAEWLETKVSSAASP